MPDKSDAAATVAAGPHGLQLEINGKCFWLAVAFFVNAALVTALVTQVELPLTPPGSLELIPSVSAGSEDI